MALHPIWIALGLGGTGLQLVVIYWMTKGFYRRFPGVFFYLLVLFLTAVADFAGAADAEAWQGWYGRVYWLNDIARHFAGFVALISVYFHATESHQRPAAIRARFIAVCLVAVAVSFLLHWQAGLSRSFFVQVGRDMSFVTAVLNLVLWFALVRTRARDYVLFLVIGGLGLNMAGEAIGQSLNAMGVQPWEIAGAIGVGSHLLCLLIWLRAVKLDALRARSQSAAIP